MTAVHPVRRPLDGLVPTDLAEVQRRAIARANDDVLRRARVRPRLVVIGGRHVEEVDLERSAGGDPVSTFEGLAERRDVHHRLLWGCLPHDPGRLAFVYGTDRHGRWWLATRPFSRRPGGVGSAERSWDVVDGGPSSELPAAVASLTRSAPAFTLLDPRPVPWPSIGCRVESAGVTPLDPLGATRIVARRGVEVEAWRRGPDSRIVVVWRGSALERWPVDGELPCPTDDLVRAVCATGERPAAVVSVARDLFDDHGAVLPAVRTVAEVHGQRIERVLVLAFGDDDRVPVDLRLFGTEARSIAAEERWIGVEPSSAIELAAPVVAEA